MFTPLGRKSTRSSSAADDAGAGDNPLPRRSRKPWREKSRGERGVVIVWFALLLVMLLGFAGFAVDLSNWWLQADRLQRAADAGAHAGVVYLPADLPTATTTAKYEIKQNGYTVSGSGADATVVVNQEPNPNRLRVRLTTTVPTYFVGLLGVDSVTLTRDAVAEYVAPIAMGSPENRLGNDPEINYNPQVWAMVGGPKSNKEWGDRYQAKPCKSGNSGCTGTSNDEYSTDGYLYVVEVKNPPSGQDLKIQIYDASFVDISSRCDSSYMLTQTQANNLVAANPTYYADAGSRYAPGLTKWCSGDIDHEGADVNTSFTVRAPDNTNFSDIDNPIINNANCSPQSFKPYDPTSSTYLYNALRTGSESLVDGKAPWTLAETFRRWATICTIPAAQVQEGRYILQVRTNATAAAPTVYNSSVNTGGHNRYSMRAGFGTSGLTAVNGDNVTISARGRLPLFANANGANAEFYLARVLPADAGRTLRVSLFDMGDAGSGVTGTLQVLPPIEFASTFSGCEFQLDGGTPSTEASTCKVKNVSSTNYQGKQLIIDVPIPQNYTCTSTSPTGCWIKISAEYKNNSGTATVNDVTTWSAAILGNPVRIVE